MFIMSLFVKDTGHFLILTQIGNNDELGNDKLGFTFCHSAAGDKSYFLFPPPISATQYSKSPF
jgi:hypothetical protein